MTAAIAKEPRSVGAGGWLAASLLAALAIHAPGVGGHALGESVQRWVGDATVLACAAICGARAVRRSRERLGFGLIGLGLAAWALGNVYDTVFLADWRPVPVPSVADVLRLAIFPSVCAGLVVLVRGRVSAFRASACLDGIIVASGAAAVSAAVVVQYVLHGGHGGAAGLATDLAYPIGDLILLAVVVGGIALGGWRLDRAWAFLAGGVVIFTVSNGISLSEAAAGSHVRGSVVDLGSLFGVMLIAYAAWQPSVPLRHLPKGGPLELEVPSAFALVALGVLVYDHYHHTNPLALFLAAATIAVAVLRMALSVRENVGMLHVSRSEARTDALTGLANRRLLLADLDDALTAGVTRQHRLLLFDLNGFKLYNDAYGRIAGDVLLTRLAQRLSFAIRATGRAYRLDGDQFCVLLDNARSEHLVDAAITATLSERGDGFSISASRSSVMLPGEARDALAALRLVDARMFAAKASRRPGAGDQAGLALLQALRESSSQLHEHVSGVASLAVDVAEALGCSADETHDIRLAAELHDIGKIAIPDAILDKPSGLTETEWSFVRQHTIIGERILAAAPALQDAARLVRASHERYDGTGYPDGLAGTGIPLGARIIAACDALDAMTSDRCYRGAMATRTAVIELRAAAGSQFDPVVIDALERLLDPGPAASLPPGSRRRSADPCP